MNRLLGLLALAVVAASCSQGSTPAAANIKGAHDLVLVDKLLFTTSTDKDELRVLDLEPPPPIPVGVRAYLRAPNPLEALAIPVLSRPSALARDLRYDDVKDAMGAVTVAQGKEVGGPWVYARRAGGSEISVVGGGPASDPTQLSEVKRIPTAAIVTAFAGSGRSPAPSRLYFATTDGFDATIQAIDLPATTTGLRALSPSQLAKDQKVLGTLTKEAVVDLIIVPPVGGRGICETTECLAIATRKNAGREGRVFLFDPDTRATRELDFGGPVRQLAIHAGTRSAGVFIAPGQRVFAILDEEKCGSFECGGVLAVDTLTGQIALDSTGLPMLPIQTGASRPSSLAVAARAQLLLPPHLVSSSVVVPTNVELPALGIITTSTGALVFFDANGLGHFDMTAAQTGASPLNVGLFTPEGILAPIGTYVSDGSKGGPIFDAEGKGIVLANGAWKSESIDIVVRGFLPGLADAALPDPANPNKLTADAASIARVRVGDTVVFRLKDGSICSTPVTGVGPTSVVVDPLACIDRVRWAVRAGGAEPFVVTASLTGFLGRTGPGKTFNYKGRYFQRVAPFDPNAPTFTVSLGPDNPTLTEDFRWTIDVQPNLLNFSLVLDSATIGCSTNVAGAVIYDPDRARLFYALPSANAVVDFDPTTARLNDNGANCYP